jgi:hypothetical protein
MTFRAGYCGKTVQYQAQRPGRVPSAIIVSVVDVYETSLSQTDAMKQSQAMPVRFP